MFLSAPPAGAKAALAAEPEPRKEVAISASAFQELAERLRARRGLDLQAYKDRYIRRRLAVRLRARSCARLEDYLRVLGEDPGEWDRLAEALTINVTNFYRNPETFELIRTRLLPAIIAWRRGHHQPRLKLWSAGCAEGDEAYSLAILLREHFSGAIATMSVSILGTDVDATVLAQAQAASYPADRLAELPAGAREKYFLKRDHRWAVRRSVANLVRFERRDLLREAGPEDLDLIVCRNVLIYFSREEQEGILARFSESLRPEGFLVLGKTETLIGPLRRALVPVLPRERIYQKPAPGLARPAIGEGGG